MGCRIFTFPDDFPVVLHIGIAFSTDNQHHGAAIQSELIHQRFALWVKMYGAENAQTDSARLSGNHPWIGAERITQYAHPERGYGILTGDKLGGAVAQNVPAQRIGFAAGQACHNRGHAAANVDDLTFDA